jgi:hypothetical protein
MRQGKKQSIEKSARDVVMCDELKRVDVKQVTTPALDVEIE